MTNALWSNFLGHAPEWYKRTILAFLVLNPLLLLVFALRKARGQSLTAVLHEGRQELLILQPQRHEQALTEFFLKLAQLVVYSSCNMMIMIMIAVVYYYSCSSMMIAVFVSKKKLLPHRYHQLLANFGALHEELQH